METTPGALKPRAIPRDEVPELLAELERTGEGVAALCRRRGLAPWRLYEARRRANAGSTGGDAAARAPRPARPSFAEVRVRDQKSPAAWLRVTLGPPLSIEVPCDFDAASLRRLVEALRSC